MFDVLIIGGGSAGMSCALVLGSAHTKRPYAKDKHGWHRYASKNITFTIGIVFNNVLGVKPGTTGAEILELR